MSKRKWQIKHYREKPSQFGDFGDYDEYYELGNDSGDALQTVDDYDGLQLIAEALNAFGGEIRITTALEINQHCEIMELKAENERLRGILELHTKHI